MTGDRGGRKAAATLALLGAALLVAGAAGCRAQASGPKVVVIGIDGMDHELAEKYMAEGKLPNFAKLAKEGGFQKLGTSAPPLSPVAWSDFITGQDSGGHGIFDFIHRKPDTMTPYLSTSEAIPGKTIALGKYLLPDPLSPGKVVLLRHGQPFWERLEEKGFRTTVLRMPANFPPSGTACHEISGMGTPDILGTYGTFSFFTSIPYNYDKDEVSGGKVYEAWPENGVVKAKLTGPTNEFLATKPKLVCDFVVYLDPVADVAKLEVGNEERVLKVGEFSDWVPVEFPIIPTQKLKGMARFYVKSVRPEFEMYVSPVNIDPFDPAQPIATPSDYAETLANGRRFYTQGMPEDTKALSSGIFTYDEFLAQAHIAGEEVASQIGPALDAWDGNGLFFYYFGNLDQTCHMMFRSLDPQHPSYDEAADAPYAHVIPDLYRRFDDILGVVREKAGPDTLVVVMSDHGFASWRRAVHLNSWLRDNGFLTVRDPASAGSMWSNVDWSRTRAYALGLNGLYVNLHGREKNGIVDPANRMPLLEQIEKRLLKATDPVTGGPLVTRVYIRERDYKGRGVVTDDQGNKRQVIEVGPDIVVGYAKTYRGSNESALGEVPPELVIDNDNEWSGDHGMDHETVPGVLFTSRPLKKPATSLRDLASSLLYEYGIEGFPSPDETTD